MSTYLEVNECKVFATGQASKWWCLYRQRGAGRIVVVTASLGGDLVRIPCDSREDALMLSDHMVREGLPKSALKVSGSRRAASLDNPVNPSTEETAP